MCSIVSMGTETRLTAATRLAPRLGDVHSRSGAGAAEIVGRYSTEELGSVAALAKALKDDPDIMALRGYRALARDLLATDTE